MGYFRRLFASSCDGNGQMDIALGFIQEKITNEMNDFLMCPYTEAEIHKAVFQMGASKALGPDGFPTLFYQKYWHIVKDKIVQACLEVLNGKIFVRPFNQTLIILIPKKRNPKDATDFRPISLCNVLYKIIAKVIANRLKVFLPSIVVEAQSAFVPERLISDNILVSQE